MIIYTLNFLLAVLIGSMTFFMAVVSPSIFATLSTNASSKLLRTIFPRMFLFGFIIAILSLVLCYISGNILNSILLIIVAMSFIINRNYLTPKINDFRDKELEGDKKASSSFKYMHLLSVLLFVLNFVILIGIVINNYFNYNL
jgi:membrane protein insertase Oxa1/YidC/SpoIIIJ